MSYTISYTYALLPDKMEDCVGQIIQLHHNASENSKKVYNSGKITAMYVFTLGEKRDYHRSDSDRIHMIPLEQYGESDYKIHLIANMVGYEKIKEDFVSVGHIDELK